MENCGQSARTSPCHLPGFVSNKWDIASWDELKYIQEMIFPLTVRKGKSNENVSSKELGEIKYESITRTELINFIQKSDKAENGSWLYLDYKYVCDLFSEQVAKMFDWAKLGLPESAHYVCAYTPCK